MQRQQYQYGNTSDGPAPSAPPFQEPPSYYESVALLPDPTSKIVLFDHLPSIALESSSRVVSETSNDAVISYDQLLDNNAEELWKYFLSNLSMKPKYSLMISGTHVETKEVEAQQDRSDKSTATDSTKEKKPRKEKISIDDFKMDIDVSAYVRDQWQSISSERPDSEAKYQSVRDVLEDYTLSQTELKEIELKKVLTGWDTSKLKMQVRNLILSTGYEGHIEVELVATANTKVIARSSSPTMKNLYDFWVNAFLIVSLLFIVVYPFVWFTKKSIQDCLFATYPALFNERYFFELNKADIYNYAFERKKKQWKAKT